MAIAPNKSPLATAAGPTVVDPRQTVAGADWQRQFLHNLEPQLVNSMNAMPGALSAASAARDKAYDAQMGLSEGYIGDLQKPTQDMTWGRFGAALMAPTRTGNFSEGLGNAFSAAMDARDTYSSKEAERREKLYRAQYALEGLRADKPNAALQGLQDTIQLGQTAQQVGGIIADNNLGNGLTPTDDAELVADYNKNPNKYGPQGRAMVEAAQARLQAQAGRQWELQKMQEESRLKILEEQAKAENKGANLTSVDKKAFLDAKAGNANLQSALANLSRAKELGPKTYSGIAPDTRAWLGANTDGWLDWNDPEDAKAHIEYQQIMTGEAIKNMADTLKGATTDREMQRFIDMTADPTLPWDVKKHAVERVKSFIESQIASNEDTMAGIGDGSLYTGQRPSRERGNAGVGVGDVVDDVTSLPNGAHVQDENGNTFVIKDGEAVPVNQ